MKKCPIAFAMVLLTVAFLSSPFAGAAALSDENGGQQGPSEVYCPPVALKARYHAWLDMVRHTHEKEQPDWMAPIVTLPATLQQQLRTDYGLSSFRGLDSDTFLSRGLEVIPTENTEVLFGNPTWDTREFAKNRQAAGWADWSSTLKYRLFSSPSTEGNYIVTFLLSTSFATGSNDISAGYDIVTPMLGFGKGFKTSLGEFDYQATVGPSIPSAEFSKVGTPITWNSAFQYGNRFSFFGYEVPLWPDFEVTWVSYPNGENCGGQQVYLAPGINIGRFQLTEHVYFVVGAAYQFAATSNRAFDHQWLITMRIPYF
ncbi:MAG: hypothetical protein ACP5IL_02850 [Syntrophobacteraceae bacterium]